MQPSPAAQGCPRKATLVRELLDLRRRIAVYYDQEVEAAMRGDLGFHAFGLAELEEIREQRQLLMSELKEHVSRHRC